MNALEVLEKARALIANEARWTRGEYARDAQGKECAIDEPRAACWCATGALIHIAHSSYSPAYNALNMASAGLGVVAVNDDKGHAATLAMFDRAIAAERAKGGA